MPISSTITCVPSGAERIASGSPISVLKFLGFDATARCGAISAVIRSFVEVLPTEPVTAITWRREVAPPGARQGPERERSASG